MKISLSLPARAKNPRRPAFAEAFRTIAPEERHRMIADAAYFRAERRGFEAGYELKDWIEAEGEVDRMLLGTSES